MSVSGPLVFDTSLSQLPSAPKERHEAFVEFFGQFLFWLRNSALDSSRRFIESEEWREKLGTIRRRCYEGVARMPPEQRDAAMLLVEETLNGFAERLAWLLGDEGVDARLGTQHAYRFRVVMEVVDLETGEIVEEETINRGGKFFGSYWGRWLNRYSTSKPTNETK
jgi:hypothetical protein